MTPGSSTHANAPAIATSADLIDVNVSLGHWPFQRFAQRNVAELDAHFAQEGITEAWVSSLDAVLYPDADQCDEELFARLELFPRLRPVKTINPALGNFRQSFAAFPAVHAIKLLPNYHQYNLADERVAELMSLAARRHTLILVQMRLDDVRNQYPLMKVPAVPAEQIVQLALAFPHVHFIALGAYHDELSTLVAADNVMADLSFLELLRTVESALARFPASRLLFGSHTPMLYTRAAVLKWQLADVPEPVRHQIARGNALRLGCQPATAAV